MVWHLWTIKIWPEGGDRQRVFLLHPPLKPLPLLTYVQARFHPRKIGNTLSLIHGVLHARTRAFEMVLKAAGHTSAGHLLLLTRFIVLRNPTITRVVGRCFSNSFFPRTRSLTKRYLSLSLSFSLCFYEYPRTPFIFFPLLRHLKLQININVVKNWVNISLYKTKKKNKKFIPPTLITKKE